MRDVLRALIEALEAGREQILCQVVETRGSTPQKAGAVMVVDPAGGQTGTLGGGCVENEVKQLAIRQIGNAGTSLRSFVLDHDYAWADGLICGGKMVVAIEALRGAGPAAVLPQPAPSARGRRGVHRGRDRQSRANRDRGRGRERNRANREAAGDSCSDPMASARRAGRPVPCRRASPRGSFLSTTVPGRKSAGAWRGWPRCHGSDW